MKRFSEKIIGALTRRPTRRDAGIVLSELLWLIPILIVCVVLSPLMQWQPAFDAATLRLALVALVVPSLGEELLFRAGLLPAPGTADPLPLGRTGIALALFVLWHPAQALFATDLRAQLFVDPWFLIAVAALGLACTRVYWRSRSLWPAVAVHWIVVAGWKALAGGPALI